MYFRSLTCLVGGDRETFCWRGHDGVFSFRGGTWGYLEELFPLVLGPFGRFSCFFGCFWFPGGPWEVARVVFFASVRFFIALWFSWE